MYLYFVERTDPVGYDEYDSFVVAAQDEETARNTNPTWNPDSEWPGDKQFIDWNEPNGDWVTNPKFVKVTKIGTACEDVVASVVIASFSAA